MTTRRKEEERVTQTRERLTGFWLFSTCSSVIGTLIVLFLRPHVGLVLLVVVLILGIITPFVIKRWERVARSEIEKAFRKREDISQRSSAAEGE
ncbi:MAG: hypothetical protein A2172_04595 [Candidatus Woykebacteria bacterium RBG_13_40_15]|uniref:Uncharacterized protein n=1 Tax=Candidatus Woykebacteria bacterium RBG_13_40_15 TaxID=1802593 RepID=A0A1G1W733_9BACT|nr:MAG: hypothetical protein A2172_04595 [Candidatus Woykebacteria bacterium RBG_13_40_15]